MAPLAIAFIDSSPLNRRARYSKVCSASAAPPRGVRRHFQDRGLVDIHYVNVSLVRVGSGCAPIGPALVARDLECIFHGGRGVHSFIAGVGYDLLPVITLFRRED